MRPMNDPTPRIPFIFTAEFNVIANRECAYPLGQVDIVRHQQRLPRSQSNDKSLVSTPGIVVGQHPRHLTAVLYLKIASMLCERGCQNLVGVPCITDGTTKIAGGHSNA